MIVGLDDGGKTSILNVLASSPTGTGTTNKPTEQSISKLNKPTCSERDKNNDDNHDEPLPTGGVSLARLSNRPHGLHLTSGSDNTRNSDNKRTDPTIGYNYERIKYKGQIVNVLDFSGQSKYRGLWQEFFNCVDGIVFVIDSSDLIRFAVVRDELENLLGHPFFATIAPSVSCFTLPQDHVSSMTSTGTSQTQSSIGVSQAQVATLTSQQLAQKQVTISQGRLIQSPLSDWVDPQSPAAASGIATSRLSFGAVPGLQSSTNGHNNARRLRTRIPILFLANKTDLNNSADSETIAATLNLNQVPKQRHPWIIQATSVRTNQGIFDGFDWLLSEILATS